MKMLYENKSSGNDKTKKNKKSRKQRRDAGILRTTERDLHLLRWISGQYAVSIDHLQRLASLTSRHQHTFNGNGLSYKGAESLYRRWVKRGWVEKRKILADHPAWIWLTKKGLRDIESDFPYRVPSVARLQHIFWVNATRLYLEHTWEQPIVWLSERRLMQDNQGNRHVADGEIFYDNNTIAIEVELTQKSQKKFRPILYDLKRRYKTVWYFASENCFPTVKRTIESLKDHQSTFVLYPLSTVTKS